MLIINSAESENGEDTKLEEKLKIKLNLSRKNVVFEIFKINFTR